MFHCVILFRLKPGVSLDRVRGARESLQALVETMPGVAHLTAHLRERAASGTGLLVVSHDAAFVEAVCDLVITLGASDVA